MTAQDSLMAAALTFVLAKVWDFFKEKRDKRNARASLAGALMAEIDAIVKLYDEIKLQPWNPSQETQGRF